MALHKRGRHWWIRISHNGRRIQRSTGTSDRVAAQEYHDKLKADLWAAAKLNKKLYPWQQAVVRWLRESQHKKSLSDDKAHLRWMDRFLRDKHLHET